MSQYKDGTASVNNNSNIVTGSGTLWLASISAGDLFTKAGDDVAYTVAGVTNNTILTLTAPYSGSSSSRLKLRHYNWIHGGRASTVIGG